jgi:hypothetical protein
MPVKYFISFVEEAVMNPKWAGFIGGRIEVTPDNSKSGYASEEIRFFTKDVAAFNQFRELYDFKDVDKATLDLIRKITNLVFMKPVK